MGATRAALSRAAALVLAVGVASLLLSVLRKEEPTLTVAESAGACDSACQKNVTALQRRVVRLNYELALLTGGKQGKLENSMMMKNSNPPRLEKKDIVYTRDWDTAPIVIEKERLIFFTVPKVACTVFKQLLRRMMGFGDWATGNDDIPHNPAKNGLKYLCDFPLEQAQVMMTSPNWTRAIFLREPHERFLSAYLDKAVHHPKYVKHHCRLRASVLSLPLFVKVSKKCKDPHWAPQLKRVDAKWWPYIDFISDRLHPDAVHAMLSAGAWKAYGESGWGTSRNQAIFQST
eukprot:COSAG01_NODE_179_length_22923_cov_25.190535_10_plen_289_part_00